MPFLNTCSQICRQPHRALYAGVCTLILFALLGSGCSTVPKESPPVEESAVTAIVPKTKSPAQQRLDRWHRLIEENRFSPIDEKLAAVNGFFNQLEFVDDMTHWGQGDYWATPEEMLISNGGDCEDFSIAKYFTLKQLNVPEAALRLTYVKALSLDQPHMVLCYYRDHQDEPLVLDNLKKAILPASARPDLAPVYCFNVEGLWLAQRRGQGERVGGAGRVSAWQSLLARMEEAKLAKLLVKVEDIALEPCSLGILCAQQ